MALQLGKKQVLTVVKVVDFGVYLGSDTEKVLLPKKQVPVGIEPGDPVEVFLYKDSSDRLIATTNEPKLTLGEIAVLEVAQVGKFGAFRAFTPGRNGTEDIIDIRSKLIADFVHTDMEGFDTVGL